MHRRLLALAVVLAIGALAAIACGRDDEEAPRLVVIESNKWQVAQRVGSRGIIMSSTGMFKRAELPPTAMRGRLVCTSSVTFNGPEDEQVPFVVWLHGSNTSVLLADELGHEVATAKWVYLGRGFEMYPDAEIVIPPYKFEVEAWGRWTIACDPR